MSAAEKTCKGEANEKRPLQFLDCVRWELVFTHHATHQNRAALRITHTHTHTQHTLATKTPSPNVSTQRRWQAEIMTGYIKNQLTKKLSMYFKDINADSLGLSFFKGQGELAHLGNANVRM